MTDTLKWVEPPCHSSLAHTRGHSVSLALPVTQLLCGLHEVTHRAGVSFHDYTVSVEPIGIRSWHL